MPRRTNEQKQISLIFRQDDRLRRLELPLAPEEVAVAAGGRSQTLSTLETDYVMPAGRAPRTYTWSAIFPGRSRRSLVRSFKGAEWAPPRTYADRIDDWLQSGRVIRLTIEDSNVTRQPVTIEAFDYALAGGHGDIAYTISLVDYRAIEVRRRKKGKGKPKGRGGGRGTRQALDAAMGAFADRKKGADSVTPDGTTITYTVKAGDTLQQIALRFLGSVTRWRDIHDENRPPMGADPEVLEPGWRLQIRKDPE